jgi:dipeptidyl-peptidase-4
MPPDAPQRLTLNLIFRSRVLQDKPLQSPQWLADSRRLLYLDRYPGSRRMTIWTYDAVTEERRPLLDPRRLRVAADAKPIPIAAIRLSRDERQLLLTSSAPARFSPCGDIYVCQMDGGTLRRLTETDRPQYHPAFSPDGTMIGVVRDSDLWVINVETGEEKRLTQDGAATVYNGRCGWVYEEELGLGRAWEWSPDGRTVAFLQQDETAVPEVLLPQYEQPHSEPLSTRYPKAGDPNPTVRLGFVDVATRDVRWADLASVTGTPPEEHYIAHLQWAPEGSELLLQYLPRLQNRLTLVSVDRCNLSVRRIVEETDEAWVDHVGKLDFVGTTARFVWPSERDGRRHLYLYDLSGACIRQLTSGDWEVTGVSAIDAERGCVYFTATLPTPTDRSLLRVPLEGGEPEPLFDSPGVHSALFAPDCRRLLHTHSTLNAPPVSQMCSLDDARRVTLTEDITPTLRRYGVAVGDGTGEKGWELLTFQTEDGTTLYGRMLKPANFDPSRHYPVLMHNYGGPGSQVVVNQWGGTGALWYHYLAQRGWLIFMCDNRGTGARGRDFKKVTYLRLGQWEVKDQIAGARFLATLPFVDPNRIAIWGWSYGGYMASLCILKGADVFRAAVAVAPVTDWRLYDTIYTERYMRTPADNPEGYRDGSPVTHAARLKGRFLLIHGTMDDNVHFQNSARLASALQDANRPFETMFYPGRHHGLENRHLHLYRTISAFLNRALRRT